jgi:hypothetical protein
MGLFRFHGIIARSLANYLFLNLHLQVSPESGFM